MWSLWFVVVWVWIFEFSKLLYNSNTALLIIFLLLTYLSHHVEPCLWCWAPLVLSGTCFPLVFFEAFSSELRLWRQMIANTSLPFPSSQVPLVTVIPTLNWEITVCWLSSQQEILICGPWSPLLICYLFFIQFWYHSNS